MSILFIVIVELAGNLHLLHCKGQWSMNGISGCLNDSPAVNGRGLAASKDGRGQKLLEIAYKGMAISISEDGQSINECVPEVI